MNRSFSPFVHGLGVGGRAARVPALCHMIVVRTVVASGYRSSDQSGNRPSDKLLGAAGRRTSLAAATMRGPPRRERR